MSAYRLRCRVCEEVTEPEPLDACRRCDGPTDVTYDWDRVARELTRARSQNGPETLWRYHGLLPSGARVDVGAGWTPLMHSEPLSDLLGIDLYLKLETATRRARTRTASRRSRSRPRSTTVSRHLLLVDGQPRRCGRRGRVGDRARGDRARSRRRCVGRRRGRGTAGAHVFAVRGTYDDCRRLELELGSLFPWGFVSGNLHPYASEGAKTISFEIAEQLAWQLPDAVVCPAASGTLFAKLAQGFAEVTRAGLAGEPCRVCSRPRRSARARSPPRSPTTGASRACTPRPTLRRSPSATRRTATWRSAPPARPAARYWRCPTRRSSSTRSCSPDHRRPPRSLRRRRARRIDRRARARRHRARLACRARRDRRAAAVDGRRRRPRDDDRRRCQRRPRSSGSALVIFLQCLTPPRRSDATYACSGRSSARCSSNRKVPGCSTSWSGSARCAATHARPASSPRLTTRSKRTRRPSSCAPSVSTSSSRTWPSSSTACGAVATMRATAASRASRSKTRSRRSPVPTCERCTRHLDPPRPHGAPDRGDAADRPLSHIRIAEQLYELDDPRLLPTERHAVEERIAEEVTLLWQTDEVRHDRLRINDEIRNGLWFFEHSLMDAATELLEEWRTRIPDAPPPLRFGSWIGGDMDGNPVVGPATIAEALARGRALAFTRYRREVQRPCCRDGLVAARSSASQPSSTSRSPATKRSCRSSPSRSAHGTLWSRTAESCRSWAGGSRNDRLCLVHRSPRRPRA